MLSVMVPVKVCLGGAAARAAAARANQRDTRSGYFIIALSLRANTVCQPHDCASGDGRRIPRLRFLQGDSSLRSEHRKQRIFSDRPYSPGVMRCAVVVPAFMIQTLFPPAFSGSPVDAMVAP